MRNLWFVIVAAILTVSCSAPSAEQDRVVIEGLIDIALPAGMFIPKSCTEGTPGESEYLENNRACVAYKFTEGDSDQNYDGAVLKALSENDWEFAGGAGNAYYLERSINAECSDKMMVVAVIQGDPLRSLSGVDQKNPRWTGPKSRTQFTNLCLMTSRFAAMINLLAASA